MAEELIRDISEDTTNLEAAVIEVIHSYYRRQLSLDDRFYYQRNYENPVNFYEALRRRKEKDPFIFLSLKTHEDRTRETKMKREKRRLEEKKETERTLQSLLG